MTARSVHALTTLFSALRRPASPAHAAQLHARLLVSGRIAHPVLLTQLVSLHADAGRLDAALCAFRAHRCRAANLHTYAALISSLARPRPVLAFSLFARALLSSSSRRALRPNPHVISAVLTACAALPPIHCLQAHACAFKIVPPADVFVYTGLVDVYAKSRDMAASRKVFDEMPLRVVASWNALVVGYARNAMCPEALRVFRELAAQGQETPLDQVSMSSVLSACMAARALDSGRQVHACTIKVGLEVSAACIYNALLDMYTKCGCYQEASALFDAVDCRDVVAWNIVIRSCIHDNHFQEACIKFRSMLRARVLPDHVSFASALHASACLAAWTLGASIHASVIKTGFLGNHGFSSSLIAMYSKCGHLDDAQRAFEVVEDHLCVMTWTAMITALQQHGQGRQAIDLFETMLDKDIKPDHITFVSVLCACSHSGLVDEGRKYFTFMTQVLRNPWSEHYACMVDMFGRAGLLGEAKQFVAQMPVMPNVPVLGALLAACLNCGDLELAKMVAKKLFEIEPHNPGNYVLLANIFTTQGRLEVAKQVRRWMMSQKIRKEKGFSLVNIDNMTDVSSMLQQLHPGFSGMLVAG